MDNDFSKLCTPAKIYFAIAVIAVITSLFNGVSFMMVFSKIFFAISWFLVLLPYIVIVLAMFQIARITEHKGIMRTLQLQGAYGQEAMTNR
jgi:hypothetical protein